MILGTILGINVRNGNLLFWRTSLVDVTQEGADLPAGIISKLIVLQARLNDMGAEREQTNTAIRRFITVFKEEQQLLGTAKETVDFLDHHVRFTRNMFYAINNNKDYFGSADTTKWKPLQPPNEMRFDTPQEFLEMSHNAVISQNNLAHIEELKRFVRSRNERMTAESELSSLLERVTEDASSPRSVTAPVTAWP